MSVRICQLVRYLREVHSQQPHGVTLKTRSDDGAATGHCAWPLVSELQLHNSALEFAIYINII